MHRWLTVLAVACAFPAVGRALEIDFGYDPNRHNMFLSGFSSNPVRNGNILGMPGLDFSGVGWGTAGHQGKNVALITPQHFVLAQHFQMPIGTTVNFLNRNGTIVSRTISAYYATTTAGVTSDLTIGEFSSPFGAADDVQVYSVVMPNGFGYYIGQQNVTVGRNVGGATEGALGGKVSLDTIDGIEAYEFGPPFNTFTVGFRWTSQANTPDSGRLVGGDSGSPSFMLYNNALTILGTNSGIDGSPQINYATLLPWYADQINAAIAHTGFQLSIIPVPEPSAFALIGVAALACLVRRRWFVAG